MKLVRAGTQVPSALRQAGWGQWQKPLLYLPSLQAAVAAVVVVVGRWAGGQE